LYRFFLVFYTGLICTPARFLIICHQQRGFRRVNRVDCRFVGYPDGAAVVPKSFVILLVLVAGVYSMMGGGTGFYPLRKNFFVTVNLLMPSQKLSREIGELISCLKGMITKRPSF
jgi:hypothetical protein